MIFFVSTNIFNCIMTKAYYVVGYDDFGEVILASTDCRSEILKIFEAFKSR